MIEESLQGQVEALLFVSGEDGVSVDELTESLQAPTLSVLEALDQLKTRYITEPHTALQLVEYGSKFVLTTKKSYESVLKEYATSPTATHLSQAALETLAIIAYKQPITRVEIDDIRGVKSSGAIQTLVLRGLILEEGRVEGPGRPILYGTSDYFMNYFGLERLTDLPAIDEMEQAVANEEWTDLFATPDIETKVEDE
ncbi:SMC-Scp complex subunit ScpB [Vagococcus humatus]|uniref:Segregation and condensation protein B n=1 Tax=Vagococcus humatus TaxID=1889241 RepID=A0A3S0GE59_9ENTE|nr:SMC-Scp complex subunit ScpB [Vagococcus humatus]RST89722.1 SMC-Scp complex subunit ScpB [Vagococcus humatus]